MDKKFVEAFQDELEQLEKVALGLGKKILLGGGLAGLGTVGLASHAAARGAAKGRIEAMESARRRRALLGY